VLRPAYPLETARLQLRPFSPQDLEAPHRPGPDRRPRRPGPAAPARRHPAPTVARRPAAQQSRPQHVPGGPAVTGDRDAVDRAAAEAVRLVAVSYAAERALAGRRSRRQRDLQARAERLARHWTRQQQGVRR
jgi:hypothetical protein